MLIIGLPKTVQRRSVLLIEKSRALDNKAHISESIDGIDVKYQYVNEFM